MRQARVGAAQRLGNAGHVLGEALDVDLVNHGRFPRRLGLGDDRERGLDHDRARHVGSGIDGGAMHRVFRRVQILVHAVRVDAGLHVDDAVEASTVGVEQELVGVKELAAVGVPRAVCAETVSRARAVARDVAVPHAPASSKMHMSTPEAPRAITATSRPSPAEWTPRRVGSGLGSVTRLVGVWDEPDRSDILGVPLLAE